MALTPAIFLDKDGTILQDIPYNIKPEKMVLAPGAAQGLARLAGIGLPLIVVTNQPGIAMEKFTLEELHGMQRRLEQMFTEAGATLDGFYFCPHHPQGSDPTYAMECDCRKPAPGLLLRAAHRHAIDLRRSWLVGDILNDVEAGRRAGCRTVLINNGNETEWIKSPMREPHFVAPDFASASEIVHAHCEALEVRQ